MRLALFLLLCLFPTLARVEGALVLVNGKFTDARYAPFLPTHEHYDKGQQLFQEKQWKEALQHFLILSLHCQDSPFYADALFFSGVCYFEREDYDMANRQFSAYLNQQTNLQHFEEAFVYKFQIAEAFREGHKKHVFGISSLPKFMPAKEEALQLYDEVISALPHRDLAAEALYSKGLLYKSQKEYKEGIDAMLTLTKRFPTHPKSVDAYVAISEIYLEQSKKDEQNPDLLALAKIQTSHFRKQFPTVEHIAKAEANVDAMGEVFAKSLYETGRYYERKKKTKAAQIYYEEAMKTYPETPSAKKSSERLAQLK